MIFWMLAGIFVFNLPFLFRRPRLDPQIEAALALIAKVKRAGQISPAQAKLMYRALCEKVLAQITLDKPTQEKIREVEKLSVGNDTPSA
jgi:hypothetical protein